MSEIEPKSSTDLRGWDRITCWQSEIVRRADLSPASSRTDMETPDVFTEWWSIASDKIARSVPVLREYRDRDGCRHYLANEPSTSAVDVESEKSPEIFPGTRAALDSLTIRPVSEEPS